MKPHRNPPHHGGGRRCGTVQPTGSGQRLCIQIIIAGTLYQSGGGNTPVCCQSDLHHAFSFFVQMPGHGGIMRLRWGAGKRARPAPFGHMRHRCRRRLHSSRALSRRRSRSLWRMRSRTGLGWRWHSRLVEHWRRRSRRPVLMCGSGLLRGNRRGHTRRRQDIGHGRYGWCIRWRDWRFQRGGKRLIWQRHLRGLRGMSEVSRRRHTERFCLLRRWSGNRLRFLRRGHRSGVRGAGGPAGRRFKHHLHSFLPRCFRRMSGVQCHQQAGCNHPVPRHCRQKSQTPHPAGPALASREHGPLRRCQRRTDFRRTHVWR